MRRINSSYRIIKILKLLHESPYSLEELCFALDEDDLSVGPKTITKYFLTLRTAGCSIKKKNGKFYLENIPFFIDLNEKEISALAYFQKFSQKFNSKKFDSKIQSGFSKILKLACKETKSNYSKTLNKIPITSIPSIRDRCHGIIGIISNVLKDNLRLKIRYNNELFVIVPKSIRFSKGTAYLNAYDEKSQKYKRFIISNITELSSMGLNKGADNFALSTIFKVNGRLAKNYYPYEKETIHHESENEKIICNKHQDKLSLIHRCLKYGTCCEIISPKSERDFLINEVETMLKNLSRDNFNL
ncbi:hypothetical protein IKA15_04540 [bacterium]|nr:hypothetical protein [bacterium]